MVAEPQKSGAGWKLARTHGSREGQVPESSSKMTRREMELKAFAISICSKPEGVEASKSLVASTLCGANQTISTSLSGKCNHVPCYSRRLP